MKVIFASFCFVLFWFNGWAQKPSLDIDAIRNWPEINREGISDDGQYVWYTISSGTTGIELVIQATQSDWKKVFAGCSNAVTSISGKWMALRAPRDSVFLIKLGTNQTRMVTGVGLYSYIFDKLADWFAYIDKSDTLVLLNLQNFESRKFPNTSTFKVSPNHQNIIFIQKEVIEKLSLDKLVYLDIGLNELKVICKYKSIVSPQFDSKGDQLACFLQNDSNRVDKYSLGHFNLKNGHSFIDSVKLCMTGENSIFTSLSPEFSLDGRNIFFYVKPEVEGKRALRKDLGPSELIWGYRDADLREYNYKRPLLAVINIERGKGVVVLEDDSSFLDFSLTRSYRNNYILIKKGTIGNNNDYEWRLSARSDNFLVSTIDGTKQLIRAKVPFDYTFFSASGKYLVWYDAKKRNWFSFNRDNNSIVNISGKLTEPLFSENDYPEDPVSIGIAGFMADDKQVLIYDRHDIWKLDLDGLSKPVNLTMGSGFKNNLRFRYMNFGGESPAIFHSGDSMLLSVFNEITKENGFAKVSLNSSSQLKQFQMFPASFYYESRYTPPFSSKTDPFFPLKAKNANVFLVKKMETNEYPNLFVTRDFEKFNQISFLSPQIKYNWYRNELIHYDLNDGNKAEGILYKPENFNSQKKYPVVFFFYERSADALNAFIPPELSNGTISVSCFVSSGYLVFVPDIKYRIGYPGESALDAVVSAAAYLSKMPWVDSSKMGLQGLSFGGYETNYIVTRTSRFAAAASSSGPCDLMSESAQLWGGTGKQFFYELRQGRIGATLWERPDLYIKNSPIFAADKVTTPILILQNKLDHVVDRAQGMEWFTSLRRLGRKAWLIQYLDEDHQVRKEVNQLDYTIRLSQFFDHYLKDKPAPDWMINGYVPGMADRGLELNKSGIEP